MPLKSLKWQIPQNYPNGVKIAPKNLQNDHAKPRIIENPLQTFKKIAQKLSNAILEVSSVCNYKCMCRFSWYFLLIVLFIFISIAPIFKKF